MLLWFALGVVAPVSIAIIVALRRRVARAVFPHDKVKRQLDRIPLTAQTVWLQHSWGKTEAHFVAGISVAGEAQRPAVIVAHGQMGIIDSWHSRLSTLTKFGIHYLLVEYPGYGDSEGNCNDNTLQQVMVAAFDYLAEQENVAAEKIIALGRSMGGGVVGRILGHRPVAALCLMSSFTSLKPLLQDKGLPSWLHSAKLDTLSAVQQVAVPTLVVHGSNDQVIPVDHAIALAKAGPHVQLVLDRGDHDTTPESWADFWHVFLDFCHTTLGLKATVSTLDSA